MAACKGLERRGCSDRRAVAEGRGAVRNVGAWLGGARVYSYRSNVLDGLAWRNVKRLNGCGHIHAEVAPQDRRGWGGQLFHLVDQRLVVRTRSHARVELLGKLLAADNLAVRPAFDPDAAAICFQRRWSDAQHHACLVDRVGKTELKLVLADLLVESFLSKRREATTDGFRPKLLVPCQYRTMVVSCLGMPGSVLGLRQRPTNQYVDLCGADTWRGAATSPPHGCLVHGNALEHCTQYQQTSWGG